MSREIDISCDNEKCNGASDHYSITFNCGHDICDSCIIHVQKVNDAYGENVPDGETLCVCPICFKNSMEKKNKG